MAKLGTASVTLEELSTPSQTGTWTVLIVDRQKMKSCRGWRSVARQGNELLATNGCFDLLHPGHIRCLQQAAKLGDLLIVAVNDDDQSVGSAGRPVNTVEDRMAVLAALEAVDFVLPFLRTPQRG